jgi:hypothetical protein
MAKVSYEVKANVNSFEMALGDKLVRIEDGKPYETSDPHEQAALDDQPSIKRGEKGGK